MPLQYYVEAMHLLCRTVTQAGYQAVSLTGAGSLAVAQYVHEKNVRVHLYASMTWFLPEVYGQN